ncbi:MAG: septum formation initiator family protein [Paracoccaceae bacterium]
MIRLNDYEFARGKECMSFTKKSFGLLPFMFFLLCLLLSLYFTLASVQGDFGILKRIQVQKQVYLLKLEHEKLSFQVSKLQNKTRRLSDNFLDFDLLDTQARKVLGFIKPNEIIIN